jgi:hypothetical protein
MSSPISKLITSCTAEIMLMGTRQVVKTKEQRRKHCQAQEALAQAERESWQEILNHDTDDERCEFHKNNEALGEEVREYEAVMKKQDREMRELEQQSDRQYGMQRERSMGAEQDIVVSERPRYSTMASASTACTASLARASVTFSLADWTREVEIPTKITDAAATDPILDAQLHRTLWVPWWADYNVN